MPGLIVEPEKKLLEDHLYDDVDDSDDSDDSDDDKEGETDELAFRFTDRTTMHFEIAEQSLREELAELRKELAAIKMMVADNLKKILMVESLTNKVLEMLAQYSPGPTLASITVDTVAPKPDSISSSPAPAPAPAAIPPVAVGNAHMLDATA
ncbi:hypothetical protein T459_09724 [Capsicum annuum]|uniref:Uncharacterized protein n=1 Tax=Capsicum annuum TaxID=4072 RepID=A0A2G3A075_CAPAN|nr:hypothetical protein T459_09724 [Capsicum annuum]